MHNVHNNHCAHCGWYNNVMDNKWGNTMAINDNKPTNDNDTWVGILECAQHMIMSKYHVGALGRNGLITRKHGPNGHYVYSLASCDKYMQSMEQKQLDKQNAILAQLNGKHARPTTKSCKRIINKIIGDNDLDEKTKNMFIAIINKYETQWDDAYNKSHHVTNK